MLIVVSLVSILAAGVLWLELVIRAALLYVGALLGTAVYAGLVDKNMWGHVRRWAGIMIAVILVKPVIVIVLGLAGALSASDDGPDAFSAVVSGLSIILLAIFASAMIYRFVPGFGDEIVKPRNAARDRRVPRGRRGHQLARRPGASRASTPTAPAAASDRRQAAVRAAQAARQPGLRRRGRPQLPQRRARRRRRPAPAAPRTARPRSARARPQTTAQATPGR